MSAYLLDGMVKNGFHIVGVITQEDKPSGRKMLLTPSPVAKKAAELSIPCYKPHRLNKDFDFLYDLKPDLLLTFAYGQIISETILGLSKFKPLNFHGSLLPKYRGAAPLQYALYNGETETGISLMEMVKAMDAGDVYAVEKIPLSPEDNYSSLCVKTQELALKMAVQYLPLYFEGKLTGVKQDESKVTFCPSIKKEQEHLALTDPVQFVNHVRALADVPGANLTRADGSLLKIYKASVYSSNVEAPAGTVVLARKKDIVLQLEKGQVRLELLQKPGKKVMSALDFNNGTPNFTGEILK